MTLWEFGDLLIIDVTLYGTALFLEFVALIALRIKRPDAERPFRVPLNVPGLIAMTALPVTCLVVALAAALSEVSVYTNATIFAIGAVLTAPLAWFLVRPRNQRAGAVVEAEQSASE
jgi:amino acid transporter